MNYEEVVSRIHLYTKEQEAICRKNSEIPEHLYTEYGVNRGLRDLSGKGVVAGLTKAPSRAGQNRWPGTIVPNPGGARETVPPFGLHLPCSFPGTQRR